jgi:hypothetical protein
MDAMIMVSPYHEHRAHAVLELKSVDRDQRIIEGIASTPEIDRVGDVVDPLAGR